MIYTPQPWFQQVAARQHCQHVPYSHGQHDPCQVHWPCRHATQLNCFIRHFQCSAGLINTRLCVAPMHIYI